MDDAKRLVERTRNDPVWWMRETLGVELWSRQAEIAEAVRDNPRVAVRSANAVGKSFLSACLTAWFLMSRCPGYVVTTSSSWRGLEKALWPEIRRVVRGAKYPLGGDLLQMAWNLGDQWGAFGVSADVPENFAGFRTASGVFVIVDEASALDPEIYDAIMGLTATAGSKVLMIGNPLRPQGPFYDCFRSASWKCFNISALDSPNVVAGKEVIPGLATREWVDERRNEWGEGSSAWASRVLGEFPGTAEDVLIPLPWIEAARRQASPEMDVVTLCIGCDVARFGSDRTVILVRDAKAVRRIESYVGRSTMETAGKLQAVAREWKVPAARVFVDDTGVGGGVTDRLNEQGFRIKPVNFGESAADKERFANARAEFYWNVREALNPEHGPPFALGPDSAQLASELSQPIYSYTSKGQIKLESKDEIKARLGRSPDIADALAVTFAPRRPEPRVTWL